jgi:hypothetical protein
VQRRVDWLNWFQSITSLGMSVSGMTCQPVEQQQITSSRVSAFAGVCAACLFPASTYHGAHNSASLPRWPWVMCCAVLCCAVPFFACSRSQTMMPTGQLDFAVLLVAPQPSWHFPAADRRLGPNTAVRTSRHGHKDRTPRGMRPRWCPRAVLCSVARRAHQGAPLVRRTLVAVLPVCNKLPFEAQAPVPRHSCT